MTRSVTLALLLLAALGAAYLTGRVHGREALQAKLDADLVAAQAAAAETSKALAVSEQNRRTLAAQLEDAANAQPVTSPACLPIERVRRLNSIR
jgi:hypothetical protein